MDKRQVKTIADRILPAPIHRFLGTQLLGDKYRPSVGMVNFGSLRRLTPISRHFGYDRGRPIDRYYIENFLAHHADDIRGHVLEIGDASYTRQFGGDRVAKSDVLHVTSDNPEATIVGDLANALQFYPGTNAPMYLRSACSNDIDSSYSQAWWSSTSYTSGHDPTQRRSMGRLLLLGFYQSIGTTAV